KNTISIHLAMARADAERVVTIDENEDGTADGEEFRKAFPKLQQRAREAFEVSCGERHWDSGLAAIRRDDKDGVHFDWQFSGPTGGSLLIRSTWLRELARGHRQ